MLGLNARKYVTKCYRGERWASRVAQMEDRQVLAIFFRILEEKAEREKQNMTGELQTSFFDPPHSTRMNKEYILWKPKKSKSMTK